MSSINRLFRAEISAINATEINTSSKSHNIMANPAICITDAQSGTIIERNGTIQFTSDDTLYLFLSHIIPYLYAKGKAKIETITVYYNTEANNDYITKASIESYDPTDSSYTEEWSDTDDQGSSSTGKSSKPYTPNYVLESALSYTLKIEVIVGTTRVDILSIEIEWQLVDNSTPDGEQG